ncbi:hypothetical protein HETIRDRAFT_166004 [Heterobasidion irregulare TC 32-1]|uniref:Uncharacterized protein n=1 Tax=Heterobasidion irregulare (strain TC 32-1) TaxID=747525 RepID=W4KM83_HETIT|nr:uncharacterized protein HETIRDRAFT_166004 [Heterobasidion irregulare TC 32-1]ETW86490.1 hypothetical protein HETIRDRAFT_166004 [Heterobasidion irregulare TC 32-1]
MTEHTGDHAVLDFHTCLIDHLLAWFMGLTYNGDKHSFTDEQCLQLEIMMYEHNVLWINYTSYDVCQLQDSINPRTHPDIMILSHDSDAGPNTHFYPYWYARVLGIFHVMARYIGLKSQSSEMQHVDFLWVRWYGLDPDMHTGWHASLAKGLLHAILYACQANEDQDWNLFYPNIFIDQDMFMWYQSGRVGHLVTQSWDHILQGEAQPSMEDDMVDKSTLVLTAAGELGNADKTMEGDDDDDEGEEEHTGESTAEEEADTAHCPQYSLGYIWGI